MRTRLIRGVVGVIAALSLMAISTPASKGSKDDLPRAALSGDTAARIRIGASLFRQYCIVCHGPDGTGSIVRPVLPPIPDFTSPAFHKERNDARLLLSILHGKGTFMPGQNSRVTQEQARCLVGFVRAFESQPDKGGANDQAGKKPVPPLIRAQLEWLELQKKHIEEQLIEQIQQLEQDTKRQITQLRHQARRQTEILDAQKRLYLAQIESQLAEMGSPAANAAGRPPAIAPAMAEKLDKILERLENTDKRLQKLEKGPKGKRDKKVVEAKVPSESHLTAVKIYGTYCVVCHDTTGRGDPFWRRLAPELPDFTSVAWQKSRTDRDFAQTILLGKGKFHPPCRDKLGNVDIKQMVDLVRGFQVGKQIIPMKAISPPTAERLDTILDRLEDLEKQRALTAKEIFIHDRQLGLLRHQLENIERLITGSRAVQEVPDVPKKAPVGP